MTCLPLFRRFDPREEPRRADFTGVSFSRGADMPEPNIILVPDHNRGAPWSIPDAAKFLSVSERHLYRLLDTRKVRSVRIGRRRLIPDAEVRRLADDGC